MTPRVILEKSWTNSHGKRYPVGTVLQVDNILGSQLINEKIGVKYEGKYPPEKKIKTNFFKPKILK